MDIKKPSEHDECVAFVQWARLRPNIGDMLVHIPNERKASIEGHRRLKSIGVSKGAPDYILFVRNVKFGALAIEMKCADKKRARISPEQFAWIERLNARGYYACVCYGWEEAVQVVTKYLADKL